MDDTFISWQTWPQARAELEAREYLDAAALDVVEKAAMAARRWHADQLRPTGAPYLEHLLEALEVLVRGVGETDPEVLAAVLLHDVVEDTGATVQDVEEAFGPRVAELVDWVTKPPVGGAGGSSPQGGRDGALRQAKRAAKSAYLRRLRDAPHEAIVVKLADRVSNVQRLNQMPPDFQRRYYAETVTYILPLAEGHPWFASWYGAWRERFAHLR